MALIKSRDEFQSTLAATTAEMDGLAASQPDYPVWGNLKRQLHAMTEWSAAGDPTPEQREMISIGLIAVRELEPPPPEMEDLVRRLHQLNYAWKHWPPG
jgi:hypothetical protein